MSVDRRSIKAAARERLRSAEPRPLIEGLLFVLTAGALTGISYAMLVSNVTESGWDTYMKYIMLGRYEDGWNYLSEMAPSMPVYLISRVLDLLCALVAAGLSIFSMNTLREKEEASLWNLLDGFGRFFPLLLLLIMTRVLITVWTQLLVIPGVIAYYRYRLALYLMLDHPQINPLQAILLSGKMMQGHKWSFFLLDLSFLGWGMLALLPLLFGAALGLPTLIAGALCSAAILVWLAPYYEMSCVGFYEAVKTPVQILPPDDSEN